MKVPWNHVFFAASFGNTVVSAFDMYRHDFSAHSVLTLVVSIFGLGYFFAVVMNDETKQEKAVVPTKLPDDEEKWRKLLVKERFP